MPKSVDQSTGARRRLTAIRDGTVTFLLLLAAAACAAVTTLFSGETSPRYLLCFIIPTHKDVIKCTWYRKITSKL